ncbi:hypothetical protein [Nocardia miyunensis]|uniref:hypothetical protein n=1 Tax=Nocardia miyunensis TaxID=282684 RepID=UPI001FDF1FE4|nr:hypothetical protein [Nocardia miyunensis]
MRRLLSRVSLTQWLAIILTVLAIIFIVENRHRVNIEFPLVTIRSPMWLVLLVMFVVGWLARSPHPTHPALSIPMMCAQSRQPAPDVVHTIRDDIERPVRDVPDFRVGPTVGDVVRSRRYPTSYPVLTEAPRPLRYFSMSAGAARTSGQNIGKLRTHPMSYHAMTKSVVALEIWKWHRSSE